MSTSDVALPRTEEPELALTKLRSAAFVYAPGLFRWAVNGYKFPEDRNYVITVIASTWSLTRRCAEDLLSGKTPHTIEDDSVVFQYPSDQVTAK